MGVIHHVVTRTNWTMVLSALILAVALYAALARVADALKSDTNVISVTVQMADKSPIVKGWRVNPDGTTTPLP